MLIWPLFAFTKGKCQPANGASFFFEDEYGKSFRHTMRSSNDAAVFYNRNQERAYTMTRVVSPMSRVDTTNTRSIGCISSPENLLITQK